MYKIAAFVSSLMMFGVVTLPMEFATFGKKAAILRNVLALEFSFLVVLAMGMIFQGFIGAFLSGVPAGIFASPCFRPVLIILLGIIAGKGNFGWGILLMLLYSLDYSVLVIVSGTWYINRICPKS